ncbi:unnamed protein product [Rhizoctonia solani]|uniref:Uncharacterized protein n=1 Tax=Rhizoctonia solani TaxID=456999 RepID=A0A8H3CGI4_9AGAM|nr:unnamed protein product [Rhizoctonia solani]
MPFRQPHIGLSYEPSQPSSSQLPIVLDTSHNLVSPDQTVVEHRARGEEFNYGSLASSYRHIISTVAQASPSPTTDSSGQSFEPPVVEDMLHRAVEGLRYLDPTRAEQFAYPGEFGAQPIASGAVASEGSPETVFVQYYEDGKSESNPTKKKVPYETLRKHFRNSQKHIEREFGAIQSASAELAKPRLDDRDPVETAKVLDGIITRVEGLKKRLLDIQTNHVAPTQVSLRQRLDHLTTLESAATTDQPEYIRWTEARTDRWLVDWALRNSRDETALTLAREKGLELLVDTELFAEIRKVEDALREQKCAVALAWCSENKAALKKMKAS